jgi:hypothetical protein
LIPIVLPGVNTVIPHAPFCNLVSPSTLSSPAKKADGSTNVATARTYHTRSIKRLSSPKKHSCISYINASRANISLYFHHAITAAITAISVNGGPTKPAASASLLRRLPLLPTNLHVTIPALKWRYKIAL